MEYVHMLKRRCYRRNPKPFNHTDYEIGVDEELSNLNFNILFMPDNNFLLFWVEHLPKGISYIMY